MNAAKTILSRIDKGLAEYEKDQSEYYDEIAKIGGWRDFDHLYSNKAELSIFSIVLFDILCEERGFEQPFSSRAKSQ